MRAPGRPKREGSPVNAPRFFVTAVLSADCVGQVVELPEAAAHHALRVRRLTAGEALTLFDGQGGEYAATIERADRRGAQVRVTAFDPIERESPLLLTLAQGIAANDAMDFALRKAVELGVTSIQPLVTARSAPLPAGERGERRHSHWQQIAIAACEQCGRNRIPLVAAPLPLPDWLAAEQRTGLILVPGGQDKLAGLSAPRGPLTLLVGPEGGFAEHEMALARRAGLGALGMGPRVLRTETAGIAALAAMQVLWGDG
jgi:16S rRNA (uracil1498-N3)-methyltransferase